ncbi:MAG: glycoside hydrolase family 65 protein [bacterium]|nr:glycoside hydrolase family 65 protein [bacterium]
MNWRIERTGYDQNQITSYGNRFLTGNGYMGIRGTLEEYTKEQLAAVNLAGVYDRVGQGWREPLNAPNPLYTCLKVDGEYYRLPDKEAKKHSFTLDFRHGICSRKTVWHTLRGDVCIESEHFADLCDPHIIRMKYAVKTKFHGDIEVLTGIDADVWDINGPHYDEISLQEEDNTLIARATTHEKGDHVYVTEQVTVDFPCEMKTKSDPLTLQHRICFVTEPEREYCIEKTAAVYTDHDGTQAEFLAGEAVRADHAGAYQTGKRRHCEAWERLWAVAEVQITGDDEAMYALNYSIYHLQCIAPRHTDSLSIAARGLSGQTYKGAVFWDTEMFMLDFFLYTQPAVAKTLLKYRIDTLPGALQKAKEYGYQGAFYAWESQEGGYDACTDYNVTDVFTGRPMRTYFKDKQVHISAAIVSGIMRYVNTTGDDSLLTEGGYEVIYECARFYYSLLTKRVDREQYEILDVIGPDEYHERVNNNGYTNRMAKYVLETAAALLAYQAIPHRDGVNRQETAGSEGGWQMWAGRFEEAAEKLYIPQPDKTGIVEQFDGYRKLEDVSIEEVRGRLLNEKEYWGGAYGVASHTQIIKQADVATWMNLFPQDFAKQIMERNWNYYEPRTEHGSSLSACMYAMLACKCDNPDKAYPFFLKSANADLSDGGKEWAGLVYIGGTHPAAAGGAYMTAIEGFAGIYMENGELKAEPHLPKNWSEMRFHIWALEELYEVCVKRPDELQTSYTVTLHKVSG